MEAAWLISLISGSHAALYLKCTNSKHGGLILSQGHLWWFQMWKFLWLTGEMGFWLSPGDQIQPFFQGPSSAERDLSRAVHPHSSWATSQRGWASPGTSQTRPKTPSLSWEPKQIFSKLVILPKRFIFSQKKRYFKAVSVANVKSSVCVDIVMTP